MRSGSTHGEIRWFGNNIPFLSRGRWLDFQQDERLIKNDLLQLLLTSPGERVMLPDFGTNIRNFVFDNITDEALDDLESNIRTAINRFEPRITVRELQITQDGDHTVIITIQSFLNVNPSREFLFQVQLQFDDVSKRVREGRTIRPRAVNVRN